MSQSLLNRYAALEKEAEAIKSRLESMQGDPRLQREFEFKDKLTELMEEFDKSASDVLRLLNPEPTATTPRGRAKRKLKVYKNPATGEVVETRGGNQKTVKAWKDEHGHETVEGWVIATKD